MSRVESFSFSKTRTEGTIQKTFGLTVRLPEQFTEEGLQQAIARAEAIIDGILNQPELPQLPKIDLEEINSLPWRTFTKGSEPGSAKKGFLITSAQGPVRGPNTDDLPGWCFRNEGFPEGSTKNVSTELAEAIEKAEKELQIGEWIFTLKGDKKNLINRRKEKSKSR